jgi:hypothetical protein
MAEPEILVFDPIGGISGGQDLRNPGKFRIALLYSAAWNGCGIKQQSTISPVRIN